MNFENSNVDILDVALRELLGNEPVQEGVQMDSSQTALMNKNPMLWDSSQQSISQQKDQLSLPMLAPVSMETDYSVQQDCLNSLVDVDCLKPSLPKALERSRSVENLFAQLTQPQDGEDADGSVMEVEEVTLNPEIVECDQSFNAALHCRKMMELNDQFEKVLQGGSECQQVQTQYQQEQPQYQLVQPQYQLEQPQYQLEQPQYQELPSFLSNLSSDLEPQQKTSATNMACTLEYTQENRLQVTQVPEQVNPVNYESKRVTNSNVPNLEILKRPPKEELPSPVSSEELGIFDPFNPIPQLPPMRIKVEDKWKPATDLEVGDLLCKAEHIKAELGRMRSSPTETTKVQVPDFVLFALQHKYCSCNYNLSNLFNLCDKDGRTDSKECDHFVATDTKAIGQLWQIIKGNRHSNYDTFARGLRVGRERNKGIIDYLDSGKGTKKRIYKLSPRGLQELKEMRQKLRHPR